MKRAAPGSRPKRRDLHRFSADVLADNWRMLHLLSRETDIRGRAFSRGVLTLEFERRGEPAPAEDGP
ncbi:MAG TPA: hypothetical protein VFM94_07610 [Solirubrobacterales bacterium]|nr:hypothetical protein [Solirubrobacterales bacterium]